MSCSGFSGCGSQSCEPCFFDIAFVRGDTFELDATFELSGTPYNITGATITMTAKTGFGVPDSAALFSLTSPIDIVITDAVAGMFTVTIPSSATIGLAQLKMIYDIVVEIGTFRATVFRGNLTLYQNVSDS